MHSIMRTIKKIHKAVSRPIADLKTYSPLPSRELEQIDPFLFLNHHGPQQYPPNNRGLPFGPHPHRGMETVTFILSGDIMHKDSGGHESIVAAGGVQWMTAGSGLIHSEVSSDSFKNNGGALEILQLWINLPAKNKMMPPHYEGFQKEKITVLSYDAGKVSLNAISGTWDGKKGAFETVTRVNLSTIHFQAGGKYTISIPTAENIFFYTIKGTLEVNGTQAEALHLVEFNNDDTELTIEAKEESILLLGFAPPINEPMVARGPFVMNTEEEIAEAYEDYGNGKFGKFREA
jgi:redox-sensitive bicupin YhaK (pirin superfamily)